MDEVSIVGNLVMHELLVDVRKALVIWLGLVVLLVIVCAILSWTSQRGRDRRAARSATRARRAMLRERRRAVARAVASARKAGTGSVGTGSADGTDGVYASANAAGANGIAARVDRTARVDGAGGLATAGQVTRRGGRAGTAGADAAVTDPVAELRRYAEEVAVAAGRAAETAERRRQEWRAVLNAQEAAWRAYETADQAARRSMRASVFPLPDAPLTADEAKRRERYLLRAATGAYHRGELTIDQLSAAMMHRGGWDPHRHPFELDLILRCTGRSRLLRTYHAVSDIERTVWHEAQMAAIAQRSLNEEAFAAAMRVHLAQHPRPARTPRRADPVATNPRPVRPQVVARGRATVRLSRGASW
jgi:hypothetical protein